MCVCVCVCVCVAYGPAFCEGRKNIPHGLDLIVFVQEPPNAPRHCSVHTATRAQTGRLINLLQHAFYLPPDLILEISACISNISAMNIVYVPVYH